MSQRYDNLSKVITSAVRLLQAGCVLLFLLCGNSYADTVTIYHFNPESHSDRNLVLKNTFDRYFQTKHNIELQPVDDFTSFENIIATSKQNVFIMSYWHYLQLAKKHPHLSPALQGTKDGKNTYRKLYIGKRPLPKRRTTIAVSGTERYVNTILTQMDFNASIQPRRNFRLLKVPKDIDALLAVSFGMADAALASDSSYEKLSLLYRNEYQQLEILGTSKPQQRLVVVLLHQHQHSLQHVLNALETMDQTSDGKLGLNLLGLDEWTRLKTTQTQGGQP